jgi:hypothetical protein
MEYTGSAITTNGFKAIDYSSHLLIRSLLKASPIFPSAFAGQTKAGHAGGSAMIKKFWQSKHTRKKTILTIAIS